MTTILITGCSTGIRFATADMLARNGHTVYATMRNPQRLTVCLFILLSAGWSFAQTQYGTNGQNRY